MAFLSVLAAFLVSPAVDNCVNTQLSTVDVSKLFGFNPNRANPEKAS